MITIDNFQSKKVGVLGLGKSGIACVKSLLLSDAYVYAWDDNIKNDDDILSYINLIKKNKTINIDKLEFSNFQDKNIDLLVVSPGIADTNKIIKKQKQMNCNVVGEVYLLWSACKSAKFIGITGTNGKSTTTFLTYYILKEAGIDCQIGGNFDKPALSLEPKSKGVYILEMSSYMLERVLDMRFDIGCFLNLSNDHLDRHGDMQEYLKAKAKIFNNMSKECLSIVSVNSKYGLQIYNDIKNTHSVTTFSNNKDSDFYNKDNAIYNGSKKILEVNSKHLEGNHNMENVLCSYLIAKKLGVKDVLINSAIKSFKGLKHRLQYVRTLNNTDFINDSKATNVVSAINAIKTYKNIFWIAGGMEKQKDYSEIYKYLTNIKKAYFIGESKKNMFKCFKDRVDCIVCDSMQHAVELAFNDSVNQVNEDNQKSLKNQEGLKNQESQKSKKNLKKKKIYNRKNVVLLSPACASFDMYANFEKRGDDFIKIVDSLN